VPGAALPITVEDDLNFHARLADLADASLVSLARAGNEARQLLGEGVMRVSLYGQRVESYAPLVSPAEPVEFGLVGDRLSVRSTYLADGPAERSLELHKVVTPMLRRYGAHVMRTLYDDDFGRTRARVEWAYSRLRGRRVQEAYELGLAVRDLASAANADGRLTPNAVSELVLAGKADLLRGQREGEFFDVKGAPYDIKTPHGAYELAKDVAAFANAGGGLLVCGLRRKADRQGDFVGSVAPVPLQSVKPRGWEASVRNRIVPAPVGVRVRVWPPSSERGFVLVNVPPQVERLQPFLVKGGRNRTGKLIETYITVPVRVGEHTDFMDAAQLHGLLAAGRVALGHGAPRADAR
jgi:hypothetical protein